MTTSPSTTTAARYAPRPAVQEPQPWSFPRPRVSTLAEGVEVRAYHLPGKRLVSADLLLRAGAYDDPAGAEGLAALTMAALTEGSGDQGSQEFAAAVAAAGASLVGDADLRGSVLRLSCPASRLDAGLELMTQALTRPRLAAEDVDREIGLRIEELAMREADPGSVAAMVLDEAYHPEGSRAGLPDLGTRESLPTLGAERVRAFYEQHLGSTGAVLVLAGDLEQVDLDEVLGRTLGTWRGAAGAAAEEPVHPPQGPRLLLVDRPGSVQSHLALAWPAVTREDPAWAGLQVATHVVGGSMESWLNQRLREEKGYTYGVGSYVDASARNSRLTVQTAVESEATGDAVADVLETLRRAVREGIDEQEHGRAVAELDGSAPLQSQTAAGVAMQAVRDAFFGLPLDYADQVARRIRESTAEEASRAFAEAVDHDRGTVVVVGDAAQIAGSLADLGLGEPEVVSR